MTEETTAFANAMIFDGLSAELREGCVRVAGGTIVEVGEGPEAGDRVVDCSGRTVVPGLVRPEAMAIRGRRSSGSVLAGVIWRRWWTGLTRCAARASVPLQRIEEG